MVRVYSSRLAIGNDRCFQLSCDGNDRCFRPCCEANEAERIWMACMLYTVKKLERKGVHAFTPSQVLWVINLSDSSTLPQFLRNWIPTLERIFSGEDQEILMVLSSHYKKFQDYSSNERTRWLLFLAALLGRHPNLLTCTNTLLAVIVRCGAFQRLISDGIVHFKGLLPINLKLLEVMACD
ncbi:hypothetical protein SELMODRAFT_417490 [Selaginella moellendorffii]|uniref:Uncharacterized protein n=1 Tax=Selaginella moellendorffii TaxID=88036 RepID=D8S2E2_SELML|nr:hypothetical protein SELMODRAFT_417490 [Selaginella moellendorffii]